MFDHYKSDNKFGRLSASYNYTMANFTLSEFQKKKIMRVFDMFYDISNDKIIEWKDFTMAIKKISDIHEWPKGGAQQENAMQTLKLIWEGLKKYADDNQDDKVTVEEWFKMWTECLKASKEMSDLPPWQVKYMNFMFDVNDTSGDDLIDVNEYTTVYTDYGIPKEQCVEAFNTFSDNGKVKITRTEFGKLWAEYFLSDDRSAKGNFLFGPLDF
ncbi:unnamed protein product [Owenia fusiformis]|uniref:Uncharacterized protein n=1 Tax=Owenia fusiformis TaxID=6347 RepID=A0A8J1UGE2_OWEFU|nr:unnamed protein product [Owenia fusiformis]